jgi:O-antigen/teichoic acid export membrane protein
MRLNWSAVLLAGIADWIFGAVWFTALKAPWQAGTRISPEELQAYTAHPDYWPYIISLLCSILIALVIARLLGGSQSHGLFRGIRVGILVGLAAALAMVTEMFFEMRTVSFMMISAAYPLVGCILMGIIIGVWKPKAKPELSPGVSAA